MTNYRSTARISGGTRDLREYVAAVGDSLRRDAGILPPGYDLHPGVGDVCGQTTPVAIARNWFDAIGINSWRGQPDSKIIAEAINVSREIDDGQRDISAGTENFTGILQNIATVSLLLGWARIRHTWRDICRTLIVPDFLQAGLAGASEIQLARLGEHGTVAHTPASDRVERVTPVTFAGIFSVSREALLGDRNGALTIDPFRAGVAASARVNQSVYELLALASGAGATLNQTGRALFNTTDGTLAASAAALSVATINLARKAIRRQTDPSTARRLNIAPAILLATPSLEETARVLVAADNIPGDANNLRVVIDSALEDISTTGYYLLADPQIHDTLAIAFVGSDEPTLESKAGWDVDGVEYKVRIPFAPVATDYRGVYRNAGA